MVKKGGVARKIPLMLGVALMLLGLMVSFSTSVFEDDVTLSQYGGVTIESRDELDFSDHKIQRAGQQIPEAGTDSSSPVTMSTPPLSWASTGVPKKDWYYRTEVYCIAGTTPASTTFKIELYRWIGGEGGDYELVGTLYVQSDSDPADDEGVKLSFDLGSSKPAKSEAFFIIVSRA